MKIAKGDTCYTGDFHQTSGSILTVIIPGGGAQIGMSFAVNNAYDELTPPTVGTACSKPTQLI